MSKAQFLAESQKPGEVYAGLILGQNGEHDYHLFILPGEAENVNFEQAKEFVVKAGGDLPTRREFHVLFANAKSAFKESYYWSGEQHAGLSVCAWRQNFSNGYQSSYLKSICLRARAVRRLPI